VLTHHKDISGKNKVALLSTPGAEKRKQIFREVSAAMYCGLNLRTFGAVEDFKASTRKLTGAESFSVILGPIHAAPVRHTSGSSCVKEQAVGPAKAHRVAKIRTCGKVLSKC